jgi:(1->4)-alpha-D-glucan 1-alpha-D-glucosylmutase
MLKAARESKSRTSWTEGDESFERALAAFVDLLLLDERGRQFRSDVAELVAHVGRPGLWGALSRVLVHLAGPGTPDLYQGDELWSFTLVDPDNRRPVDYALRARLLDEAERAAALDADARAGYLAGLLERPEDGRVKLYLTHRLLRARRRWPALFREGSYEPVAAEGGERAAHLFAFLRRGGGRAVLAVAPRLVAALGARDAGGRPPVGALWEGTRLLLPEALTGLRWECALTGRSVDGRGSGAALLAADALATFPVALLTAEVALE